MPHVEAFRGLRYDLARAGRLSSLVAPPYDVIDADLRARLAAGNSYNAVELILPRDDAADASGESRYKNAAETLRVWRRDGLLRQESDPALYLYHQVYDDRGRTYTRRGFMCRMRIERLGEGQVFPHEETHGGAKADRLKLWRACRANLSQIFGLYPDPENRAPAVLEAAVEGTPPLEATDHLGVVNRVWPVTDLDAIGAVKAILGGKPLYIADGHHRYETAVALRDEVAAQWRAERGADLPLDHPANYVLVMCVSMSDAGMLVLPTHRLFRGMPAMTAGDLAARLGACFTTEPAGEGPAAARDVWELVEAEDEQGTLAFYTAEDRRWTLCRVTGAGRDRMASVAAERSEDWRSLGVSLLHRLAMDELLGGAGLPAPKYVRAIDEVVHGLERGDDTGRDLTGQQGSGGRFELAAIVMPASIEDIRRVSNHHERMPAKSTYFYPKLLSGLVLNPLE